MPKICIWRALCTRASLRAAHMFIWELYLSSMFVCGAFRQIKALIVAFMTKRTERLSVLRNISLSSHDIYPPCGFEIARLLFWLPLRVQEAQSKQLAVSSSCTLEWKTGKGSTACLKNLFEVQTEPRNYVQRWEGGKKNVEATESTGEPVGDGKLRSVRWKRRNRGKEDTDTEYFEQAFLRWECTWVVETAHHLCI